MLRLRPLRDHQTSALVPDDVAEQVRTDLRQSLARALVNARPPTVAEWSHLLWAMDWSSDMLSPLPWRCYNRDGDLI